MMSQPTDPAPKVTVGVDIGGTFTDVVFLVDDGRLLSTKVPSTPDAPIRGVIDGIKKLTAALGGRADIDRIAHGTTVATNALLERRGARIGILTTKGFEDVLEIGRQSRSDMYDLLFGPQTPVFLAPRRLRVGIRERVDARGRIVIPLDDEEVRAAVRTLRERYQVEAVAVCYLFSYLNPQHEERTAQIIHEEFPELGVSLSSRIDPVIREYERLVVTAFDAYLRPVVESYLRTFQMELARLDIRPNIYVMQSRGGLTSLHTATDKAVQLVYSGPAAGVLGGVDAGRRSGVTDIITLDMGGTSADVSVVVGGKPLLKTEMKLESYPLRMSAIDMSAVGAGGGSIAWIDPAGGLRVGPESAGAVPGPACYGRGGRRPTVTDANLVLGYLNPGYFAAGEMELSVDAAARAIETHIARPLGMDLLTAAWGIHRVVTANMADTIRLITVKRGHDPRKFGLVVLGGAAGIHAASLARDLGISKVIVPRIPGVLSAYGLLMAAVEHDYALTLIGEISQIDPALLREKYAQLDETGFREMEKAGIPRDQVLVRRYADLRYVGQVHELVVEVPAHLPPDALDVAERAFHQKHGALYGYADPGKRVEMTKVRAEYVRITPRPDIAFVPPAGPLDAAQKGRRPVYFHEAGGRVDTPVFDRQKLPPHVPLAGPAVVEQPDTTIVLPPGTVGTVDGAGNLVVRVEGGAVHGR